MEFPHFLTTVFVLSLLDIVYTFYNVGMLRKHAKNWSDAEYNPLVRASWHIFGFGNGTFIAGAATLAVVITLAHLIGEREFLQGLVIGAFIIIHHYHYINYHYISRKYLGKKSRLVDRILANL